MIRSMTLLAVLACVAAPAFAADKSDSSAKDSSAVTLAQNNSTNNNRAKTRDNRGRNRGDRDASSGAPAGSRTMTTLSPYPLYERGMGRRFWQQGYVLTPIAYRRLRRAGFSMEEAYMIANASRETGLDPITFEQAIYNGMYTRHIAYEYGIDPYELRKVMPEWKTQAWADAVHEPVLTKDRLDIFY